MIKTKVFSTRYSADEFIKEAKKKRYIKSYSIGYTSDYDVVVTMILTKLGKIEM